jgi:hypothetical protein
MVPDGSNDFISMVSWINNTTGIDPGTYANLTMTESITVEDATGTPYVVPQLKPWAVDGTSGIRQQLY